MFLRISQGHTMSRLLLIAKSSSSSSVYPSFALVGNSAMGAPQLFESDSCVEFPRCSEVTKDQKPIELSDIRDFHVSAFVALLIFSILHFSSFSFLWPPMEEHVEYLSGESPIKQVVAGTVSDVMRTYNTEIWAGLILFVVLLVFIVPKLKSRSQVHNPDRTSEQKSSGMYNNMLFYSKTYKSNLQQE